MPDTDIEKFREEVRARLMEIGNPRLSAAFALRVALMALPMLAHRANEEGFLWYWPENDREKHLLAVCRAFQVGWSLPLSSATVPDAAIAASTALAYAVYAGFAAHSAYAAYVSNAHANRAEDLQNRADDYAAGIRDNEDYEFYDEPGLGYSVMTKAAEDATKAATAAAEAAITYAVKAYSTAVEVATGDIAELFQFIRQELKRLSSSSEAHALLAIPLPRLFPEKRAQILSFLRQLPTFDYWADWLQDRYDGRPQDPKILEKTLLLPEEIAAQDPRAINRYLAELATGEKEQKIKWVRAIFIGNGEAGKTSLIQALNGEEVTEGDPDMTCGIDISEWPVGDSGLTAHFWDFGGQVIAHATHQFFLRARCVYVLVINARSADNNPNQQAEYWLEFVRAFGNEAPVLLVGNKCDLTPVAVDTHRLRESHPNIRGFHTLSATGYRGKYGREFGIFRDAFVAELEKVGEVQPWFSHKEFAVIERLRDESRKNPFLGKATFDDECAGRGIDGERREGFLTLLDQLGEVIHFPEIYRARGFREYLLNPRWLTHGVYTLLYSELLKRQCGELRRGDVSEILRDRTIEDGQGNVLRYPEKRLDFLIWAMAQFKLCYPSGNGPGNGASDRWIVPDLLPSDQPEQMEFDEQREGALRFRFRFERFLPRHVLNMFIVEHYRDIHDGLAWQHGVHLESRAWAGTAALVRADYQERVLTVAVCGAHVDKYFNALYASVSKILERMPKLQHEKLLYLDEAARVDDGRGFPVETTEKRGDRGAWANFDDLLAADAAGSREFVCRFGRYDLGRVLRPMPKREGSRADAVVEPATMEVSLPVPEIRKVPMPEPEPETRPVEARSSPWLNTMVIFSGLGGLAALVAGIASLIGWFSSFTSLGWGITLVLTGNVVLIAVLLVIGSRSRDRLRQRFPRVFRE